MKNLVANCNVYQDGNTWEEPEGELSYQVVHSDGQTDGRFATSEAAVSLVSEVYGDDCEIRHDGDLTWLCWVDERTSRDDDGARACCRIVASRG